MKKTIYVDMDGVLSDFEKQYKSMFGELPKESRDNKERGRYSELWHSFVDQKGFEQLNFFNGALLLLKYLEELTKVDIFILTSSGGSDRHHDVTKQKLEWLKKRFVEFPAIVVPGRRFKKMFANKHSLLIDDTPDVVEAFIDNGGEAILHKEAEYTITLVESFLGRDNYFHGVNK